MSDDSTVFARPTSSAMAGKQTATLKTQVTDEVAEDFARFARLRGYPTVADCLREMVHTAVYGADHVADLHARRIRSLFGHRAGIGTEFSEGTSDAA